MSFKDCIAAAVTDGRIGSRKAADADRAYDNAVINGTAAGVSPTALDSYAGMEALKAVTTSSTAMRWQRLNELRKAHKLHTEFTSTNRPDQLLEDLPNRIEFSYNRLRGQAMASLDAFIMKYKPQYGGFWQPTSDLDGIVRAMFGANGPPEIQAMAKSLLDVRNFLGKRANMEGADINLNQNAGIPQTHDRLKVRRVSEDVWVNEHMAALDWNVMRYDGKAIPANAREGLLRRTYQGIVTNGDIRMQPAQGNQANLATRTSRERFLWYKDADTWLDMQGKYGQGNIHQQMLGMIDSMSRDISVMEHLGPNPSSMRGYVTRLAKKRGAELELGAQGGKGKSWIAKVGEAEDMFNKQLDIHTLAVVNGEENLLAQTGATVRTLSSSVLLGGVFLSSIGDVAIAKWAKAFNKMPQSGVLRNYVKHFLDNQGSAQQAIRAGVIFESGLSLAASAQRYFGPMDGPRWAQRFSDIVYRTGLATLHTQTMNNISGLELLGVWADNIGKKFDDLEFSDRLTHFGITEKDWDMFRQIPLYNHNGATFLRPLDLFNQAGSDMERRAADKFGDFMQMHIRLSSPMQDLRTRAELGANTSPNTLIGQGVRTSTALLSFPATIYYTHISKILREDAVKDKAKFAAMFFTYLTMGGAFAYQMKELAKGRDPADMTTLDFWGKSIIQGGSGGIVGDLIFNNININNSEYRPETPIGSAYKALHRLTIDNAIDAWNGEEDLNIAGDAANALNKLSPKFWFMRVVWDRLVSDTLLENSDPEAYSRLLNAAATRENETGQGNWWGPGQDARAPEFSNIYGGE